MYILLTISAADILSNKYTLVEQAIAKLKCEALVYNCAATPY